MSERLARNLRDRAAYLARNQNGLRWRLLNLLYKLLNDYSRSGFFYLAVLVIAASAHAEKCRPDPNIDREFDSAVRVPLPGRLPTEISDGHQTFRVQMAKAYTMPNFNAITNYDTHSILLADNLKADQERETFYHELSHIAARLKEPIYNGCKRRTEDESIELISPGMIELLRKNPEALNYLLAR